MSLTVKNTNYVSPILNHANAEPVEKSEQPSRQKGFDSYFAIHAEARYCAEKIEYPEVLLSYKFPPSLVKKLYQDYFQSLNRAQQYIANARCAETSDAKSLNWILADISKSDITVDQKKFLSGKAIEGYQQVYGDGKSSFFEGLWNTLTN